MFLRAYRICSPQHLDEEISNIFNILKCLRYPDWFIKNAHFKARRTFYSPNINVNRVKKYISVPYISGLDKIKEIMHKKNFNVAFKYNSTIKSLLVKNVNHHNNKAGVYSVPCENCNLVYIGETGRDWEIRIKEHKYAFRSCNVNNAIFYHASENNHRILWDESKLLFKCNNFKKRRMVESVLIDKTDNFNLSKGCFKLDPIMHALVVKSLAYYKVPFVS